MNDADRMILHYCDKIDTHIEYFGNGEVVYGQF